MLRLLLLPLLLPPPLLLLLLLFNDDLSAPSIVVDCQTFTNPAIPPL